MIILYYGYIYLLYAAYNDKSKHSVQRNRHRQTTLAIGAGKSFTYAQILQYNPATNLW